MRLVRIAVTQMPCSWDRDKNVKDAVDLVRHAAGQGANIVVLQELFETPYFCIDKDPRYFAEARPAAGNETIARMQALAEELGIVLNVPFFEKNADRYFNSLAMIDADGRLLGIYHKSHIPDFTTYEEAFYFSPGDTGFMVFQTRYGRIGAAICWDQWFPEAARIMVLKGAEILIYPTAIGDHPELPDLKCKAHWQQTMQGHAAANLVIVAASNRVGFDRGESGTINYYGGSFIVDQYGQKVVEASSDAREVVIAKFDLDKVAEIRRDWGIFRTRRTDLYHAVTGQAPTALIDQRVPA